ncbi:uncharacterized protein pdzph1 [Dicentrarchus labrax]|uniref:uncharacterized protein pdzph1 n=1 Tax=Dicentrarchus labrax TaxID=13489 RepID=UPI0021F51A98|nr:uncharacterized protein pdzph1 [Dicentrarchus labrax]XP_051268220.1 uncharacterized protein pdzph1 [Dicentrarchus labrax]
MSKRGRRRNSRRKSSSSSKQSVSPYIFQKQNKSNSVSYKDDIVEKGETDSLRKENVLSGSEDEEKYNNAPPKEKRFKQDYCVNSFPNQRSIYTKTTEDKKKGVKIVTSVSVSDMEDSSPKIMFQQSHEPLSENPAHSSTAVTNIMKINCSGSLMKLELQEILQLNTSGIKTTFVFINENGDCPERFFNSKCERTWIPNNESSEQPPQNVTNPNGNQDTSYRFTLGSMNEPTEAHCDSKSVSPTKIWDNPNYSQGCSDHKQLMLGTHPLLNIKPQENRNHFRKRVSTDQFWDIPPPREFADIKYNTIEDLTSDLASCRIGACSPTGKQQREFHPTHNINHNEESGCPFPVEAEETADLSPSFDQLSESDSYEPMLMIPSLSTNRSSFTKDFINYQKRKSWIRNNSIGTVEHRACLLPKKRRQTFPGMSMSLGLMQEDLLLPYSESFSSLIMCSHPFQTDRLGNIQQGNDRFSAFGIGNYNSSQSKGSSKPVSEVPNICDGKQSLLSPSYITSTEDNPDDVFSVIEQCRRRSSIRHHRKDLRQLDIDLKQNVCKDMESLDTDDGYKVDQIEVADSGFDQEIGEAEYHSPEPLTEGLCRRALSIQVIPPSCSGSEEQMIQSHPVILFKNNMVENASQEDSVSVFPEHSKSCLKKPGMSPLQDMNAHSLNKNEITEETETKPSGEKTGNTSHSPSLIEDSNKPAVTASRPAKDSTDTEIHSKDSKTDKADKLIVSRSSLDAKEHLKPVVHKDADTSGSDHWAKRRKLFKESKQWSSAGGSSITSDITEESVSEDTRSMDMTVRDNEDRGFYTETFHSSAWIYQGDDIDLGTIPPSLNARNRAVSIRERTVRISKGTGEYPWGLRIQFSKPIVVTEVDTNGAAEEAGLMVGDYVLAVNGTDVTSIPHSEAANLARQGPDVLTLTIGSDIARSPNTPRPACRGYLHKRTQSGLIKGWRKRWFVLTHDCCLYYYRHKRDEGKRQALSAVKLEGAEVGPDVSLGKPFVFKCRPQSGNRMYFFCATSNQEMKRWLEAMGKAIHPITQNHVWVDVIRHNSNLPPLAVKNPECLGLLHKMDKCKDMWVQHYCILKDACLSLYSGIRATHAHGGIYLQGYIVREQPYGTKKSAIELKPPSDEFKTFYFCAENPNENKRWIMAIQASIKKWLPLHQALQDYMNRPPEETRM